jgi:hypothetical protein
MNNIVIDDKGSVKIIGYGESLRRLGRARVGRGHREYSAPETMLKSGASIYTTIHYNENVDCFSIGVVAWELATGTRAFPNVEADSGLASVDTSVLYCNRKMSMLSQLWANVAERGHYTGISTIMGKPLERNPDTQYSLTFFIAELLEKEDKRLMAKDFVNGLDKTADYNLWRIAWNETLTGNGLTSLC